MSLKPGVNIFLGTTGNRNCYPDKAQKSHRAKLGLMTHILKPANALPLPF
jgi:hypothetical protein